MRHGLSSYGNGKCRCPICTAAWREYMREHRITRRERDRARSALGNAVRRGVVSPQPCERCGEVEVQALHHAGPDWADRCGPRTRIAVK